MVTLGLGSSCFPSLLMSTAIALCTALFVNLLHLVFILCSSVNVAVLDIRAHSFPCIPQVLQDIDAAASRPNSSQVPLGHLDSTLVVTVDWGVPVVNVLELAQGCYQMMYYAQS